jgi:hypothetical protein
VAKRSDEDVLSGILRIPVGGVEKLVPTLKLRAVRDWQVRVADKLALIRPTLGANPRDVQDLAHVAGTAIESILELVIAYDQTGALGGREWLEENADPAQLYAAVQQMGQVTFPFVGDAVALIAAFPTAFGTPDEPSASTSSTNGRSPTGASTPASSKSVSTPTS